MARYISRTRTYIKPVRVTVKRTVGIRTTVRVTRTISVKKR